MLAFTKNTQLKVFKRHSHIDKILESLVKANATKLSEPTTSTSTQPSTEYNQSTPTAYGDFSAVSEQDVINALILKGLAEYEEIKELYDQNSDGKRTYYDAPSPANSGILTLTKKGLDTYTAAKEVLPGCEDSVYNRIAKTDTLFQNTSILKTGMLGISQDTIIPTSTQMHLVIALFEKEHYRVFASYTSKTSGTILIDKTQICGIDKKQFLSTFNPLIVQQRNFTIHPEGTAYTDQPDHAKKIHNVLKSQSNNITSEYTGDGYTKRDLVLMLNSDSNIGPKSKPVPDYFDDNKRKAQVREEKAKINQEKQKKSNQNNKLKDGKL